MEDIFIQTLHIDCCILRGTNGRSEDCDCCGYGEEKSDTDKNRTKNLCQRCYIHTLTVLTTCSNVFHNASFLEVAGSEMPSVVGLLCSLQRHDPGGPRCSRHYSTEDRYRKPYLEEQIWVQ